MPCGARLFARLPAPPRQGERDARRHAAHRGQSFLLPGADGGHARGDRGETFSRLRRNDQGAMDCRRAAVIEQRDRASSVLATNVAFDLTVHKAGRRSRIGRDAMTRKLWLGLALAALCAGGANAQKWPSRTVEMIIPFPAGGGVDIIGRSLATAFSEQFGQQFVVANRDGAAGTIGFNALASASPDGYTIGFGPTTPVANAPYLVKGVRYQVDSFDYLCQIFENVFAVVVPPDSKFKSARELFAAAAANPGKLSYGHAGNGTIPHLSVENLADALKLKFQAVPFRGDSPILPVLLKGDIDFSASAVSTIRGQNF